MGGRRLETAVLDTGPIIHLGQIESLHLLNVFESVVIPLAVHDELSVGEVPDELEEISFAVEEGEGRYEELDDGEASALSIADQNNAILLTDDMKARETAEEEGVKVHGSIGVIALAFFRGWIGFDEAVSLMRSLQETSALFVTDEVVEQGIRKLEELQE